MVFQAFAGDQVFDCAGRFGNNCGEPDPTYRHRLTTNWSKSDWSSQLTWQYIGSVDDGGDLDDPVTVQTVSSIDAQNYINLSVTKDFGENFSLTAGSNNLLDNNPPVIGDNDEQANTFPATYDVFGRSFFANAKVRF